MAAFPRRARCAGGREETLIFGAAGHRKSRAGGAAACRTGARLSMRRKLARENGQKVKPACKLERTELLEKDARLGGIGTSLITDMEELFRKSKGKNFDGLELWNTWNAATMMDMFDGAEFSNRDIGGRNASKVQNMAYMFCEAALFCRRFSDFRSRRYGIARRVPRCGRRHNREYDLKEAIKNIRS